MVDPYENLANAIVLNAVEEYRRSNNPQLLRDLERFFRSEWYQVLTSVDGEMLIQKLRKEKKQYDR